MNSLHDVVLAWLWTLEGKSVSSTAPVPLKKLLPEPEKLVEVLEALTEGGLVRRDVPAGKGKKNLFAIAPVGQERASAFLYCENPPKTTDLLNLDLPIIAAGVPIKSRTLVEKKAAFKMLPLAICARHFKLDIDLKLPLPAALVELVKLALAKSNRVPVEKIHLKKLSGDSLPALVAGPLLEAPDTAVANLNTLVSATAIRLLGISKTVDLKSAIVRQWLHSPHKAPHSLPVPRPLPDLRNFASDVRRSALEMVRHNSPGLSNLRDKVLAHHLWRRYQLDHGNLPLDQFKHLLSEANGDYLVLVKEDMIPEGRRAEFTDSEIRRGVSVYHYVRV